MKPSSDDTAVLPADPDREDSLAAELAQAAPRQWWNRGTLVLGAVALLLGGFLGGLQVQKNYGTSATAAPGRTGARTGGFPGAGAFPGGAVPTAAAPAAAVAATTGKVKLVDGTTIYVEKADGEVVTVRTGAGTTVQNVTKGKLKDVRTGDSVSVAGSAAADGTVTATTVTRSKG